MRGREVWQRAAVLAAGVAVVLGGCGTQDAAPRGTAQADAQVWFAFGLQRNQAALADAVWDVSTPTSANYTKFLSLPDVADKYGASKQDVDAAMRTLDSAGFDGRADPTRGVITGTFTVREAERFFRVPFDKAAGSDGTESVAANGTLEVPASLQPRVVDVAGGSATTKVDAPKGGEAPADKPAADPPCPSAQPGQQARAEIDQLYDLEPYSQAGLTGKGVRVGMFSIEQYSPRALELYERCFNRNLPPVEVTEVNASASQLSPSNIETSLDITFMGIMAPGIETVEVFQFDGLTSMVFPLADVLRGQLDPTSAVDVLTTSVGFCSSDMSADERSMADWLAMSVAASGVTFLASAGDGGSSSCYPPDQAQGTQYPSDSAFATSVGGTQIDSAGGGSPAQAGEGGALGQSGDGGALAQSGDGGALGQSVWNGSPQALEAGGGGPAAGTPAPPYQSGLAGAGVSSGASAPSQPVPSGAGVPAGSPAPSQPVPSGAGVRQTPDVAFVAAPADVGPIAYCDRDEPCQFEVVGGTSATAPGLAGVVALLLQDLRQTSPDQALGLLNPAIYQFAQGPQYAQTFIDITQGNNDLFGVGCCTAAPGYDMASGWGSMRMGQFGQLMAEAVKARG